MNCSEITRELAVPTGAVHAAEVERHLAACPACAGRAEAERRFERIWSATRPIEPTAPVFDTLWARVEAAASAPAGNGNGVLAAAETNPIPGSVIAMPARARSSRRAVLIAAVALAQAASILLTAVIVARYSAERTPAVDPVDPEIAAIPDDPAPPPPRAVESSEPPALAQLVFELEEGQTLIFRLDDDRDGRVVVHPRLIDLGDDRLVAFEGDIGDGPIALAAADHLDINLLNAMEGMGDLAFSRDRDAEFDPEVTPTRGNLDDDRDPNSGNGNGSTSTRPEAPSLRELALGALVGLMPPPYLDPAEPYRQVTVFGIVATPDDRAIDPKLDVIADDLLKLKPGHGFQMNGVASRRLASGESLACDLGDGTVAHAELEEALDPSTGKLRIRFTMEVDGAETFTTTVTTSPNQVFFCDKPLGDGVRMLIGIGAR